MFFVIIIFLILNSDIIIYNVFLVVCFSIVYMLICLYVIVHFVCLSIILCNVQGGVKKVFVSLKL